MTSSRVLKTALPSVVIEPFGRTSEGEPVHLFTLTNSAGMSVSIMDYGVTWHRLLAPDRAGKLEDVLLGFDTLAGYLSQSSYIGCTVGRYANRIAGGKFSLDGKTYQLRLNDKPNTLHGGAAGFDKRVWKGEVLGEDPPTVRFQRVSPDGEEGFPGTLDVSVTCVLRPTNELEVACEATTDQATVVNLCGHAYFNLSGQNEGTILDHVLAVNAEHYLPVDGTLIPTGEFAPVAGTAMDFRKPISIGAHIQDVGRTPGGYDHNYVLSPSAERAWAAVVFDPKSGRKLEIFTDQPGLQVYSGNYLNGSVVGKGGRPYRRHSGLALETQHYPDAPNRPQFPSTVLRPGEVFRTVTRYRFSADSSPEIG